MTANLTTAGEKAIRSTLTKVMGKSIAVYQIDMLEFY